MKIYKCKANPYSGLEFTISASSVAGALLKLKRVVKRQMREDYIFSAYEPTSIILDSDVDA